MCYFLKEKVIKDTYLMINWDSPLTISKPFSIGDENGTAGVFFFGTLLICDTTWIFSSGKTRLAVGSVAVPMIFRRISQP